MFRLHLSPKCISTAAASINAVRNSDTFDETWLVKAGELKPITQSSARFEIRFFIEQRHRMARGVTITCNGDTVGATEYLLMLSPDSIPSPGIETRGFLLTDNFKTYLVIEKKSDRKLKSAGTWNFVYDLIVHGLFDLRSEKQLDEILEKDESKTKVRRAFIEPASMVLELKVGNYVRRLKYSEAYVYLPQINEKQNIEYITNQLFQFINQE